MFESAVITLREGIEAALVIGIILVVLRRSDRRDLERPVYWGLAAAIVGSIIAAIVLAKLPIGEELYEGTLYLVAAAFVLSMLVWMHRKSKTIHHEIQSRVDRAIQGSTAGQRSREAWGLGLFTFLTVLREGAETVLFLSAVRLTTDAMLSFIGALVGLTAAVTFGVLFFRGSLSIDLRRFFRVTTWVLGIFLVQLLINGYHELSEVQILPATPTTMAIVGPIVRNNTLFLLAMLAIPLFVWMTKRREVPLPEEVPSEAERRLLLVKARRERTYRLGAIVSALVALLALSILYAQERSPGTLSEPELLAPDNGAVTVPTTALDDGRLHRYGVEIEGSLVRFLALKSSDGKYRAALDACEICGTYGYVEKGDQWLCLNCAAEINPITVGVPGGCNPIPMEWELAASTIRVPLAALAEAAPLFTEPQ